MYMILKNREHKNSMEDGVSTIENNVRFLNLNQTLAN